MGNNLEDKPEETIKKQCMEIQALNNVIDSQATAYKELYEVMLKLDRLYKHLLDKKGD